MSRFWLSRIVLRARPRDVHELHRLLWRAFDDGPRSFLFRADRVEVPSGAEIKALVQSAEEPDWRPLGSELALAETALRVWEFRSGTRFRFLLRANPTVRRKGSHDAATRDWGGDEFRARSGHRVAVLRESDRELWLQRKGQAAGFAVEASCQQNSRPTVWGRGDRNGKHDGVDFEGVLRVVDPDLFGASIQNGIGTAKAFGFGLLSIARLPAQ